MKKWQLALLILVVIGFGLWFVRVFPDPYHKGAPVNIYVWVQRELHELMHGEKKKVED